MIVAPADRRPNTPVAVNVELLEDVKGLRRLVRLMEGRAPLRQTKMSTVLVIDDQPELRMLFQRVLESQGYTVLTASNGQEGLDSLDEYAPGIILLDMAMPQMDGLAFLRQLRSRPRWATIPVIMLSGLMSADQTAAARKLGVDDQLIKAEFSMKELRSRVARHLPPPGMRRQTSCA
jgi:DNA-binding response OmpR family regulator